jgi:outer membrane protein
LSLIEAQNSLAIARASLNHILGFNVDQQIRVEDNLDLPEVEVTYEAAMESAYENHPALKMRTFNLKAANSTIRLAQSSYLPTLSGFYSYSWGHEEFNRLKNMFDEDYNYYLGVSLSIPVFQGFSRFANLSRAKLNYKSHLEAMEQEKRDVELNTKQAYFLMEQSKKRIAVTRNAIEAAEENLRLNREKYNLGAGTMLDLITAQVYYSQAQSDQIQSLYDYKYAVAGLERAMGRLNK